MALHLPAAVSIKKLNGGFKPVSTYNDLNDTDTNDAQNVIYTPGGAIEKRPGSEKLLNQRLFTSTDTAVGRPITGHFYFEKLGSTQTYHVVGCGDSIYNYTSATAVAIRTGLTDNSNTFWSYIQTQNPTSVSDDVVVMTNGLDPIQVWRGTGTAVLLSSFTSATNVQICKILAQNKERVYAINIVDSADVDAAVRVFRTGFGSDGLAKLAEFTENFYVGGADRDGEIRNADFLDDQLIFYKKFALWKFNPASGSVGDIIRVKDNIGILAHQSLVNTGDYHIFLSERGVFAFDGNRTVHLSEKIDDYLFNKSNLDQLQYAKAVFNQENQQYILYFAPTGENRNTNALVYDLKESIKSWQPLVTGRQVSFISSFTNSNKQKQVIYGDYQGYLYKDNTGRSDGLATGYNGTVTGSTYSTLTDSAASFLVTNNGLSGQIVRIVSGLGIGQERVISSNTATVLTLEANWTIPPNTTSRYAVGGIDSYWQSKDYDFGSEDIVKLFRSIRVRAKEEGVIDLTLYYIVDFRQLNQATSINLALFEDGFVWDRGIWGQAIWGGREVIKKRVSLRPTDSQGTIGTHLALRFSNSRANDTFKLVGFDIEIKAIGKR